MTYPFDFSTLDRASVHETFPQLRVALDEVFAGAHTPAGTSALHAHWYRDEDGRLACFWHDDRRCSQAQN